MTNTVQINLKEHFYDKNYIDDYIATKEEIPDIEDLGGVVNVVKQQEAEAGYASTYYVTQDGTQVGPKINIPKDFLVRSASIKTVTTVNQPQQGFQVDDKYLDFVINVADDSATNTHVYVNVKDLFNEYQAGTGLTLSNNTFSITPGTIPTDVSDLTDTEDTEFTPKSHDHGYINNQGQILKPGSSMPTTTRSGVVVTNNNGEAVSSQYLSVNKIQDSTVHTHIGSAENATQDVINAAIDTKFDNINTAIDTINNAGYITTSDANLNNYYTKTQVDEMNCGKFAELQSLINAASNGGTVILNKDYKNAGSENSIKIRKPLNIIGNGHIIDADNKSSIFEFPSTDGTNCLISDVYFINGQTDAGGAIHCGLSSHIIRNCVFNNNIANRSGGAIFSSDNYNLSTKIENCLFNNNSAGEDGGAIYADKTDVINDCIFNNNTATGDGGGICCAHYSLTVIGCKFTNSTLYQVTNKDYLTDHQDISNKLEFSDLDDMIGLSYDNSTGILSLTFTDPNNNS